MAETLTTEQQLEAANARIAELEAKLKIEPSLEDQLKALPTEQLIVTVGDELMGFLGHHPRMWSYWKVLRDRINPPAPAETAPAAESKPAS